MKKLLLITTAILALGAVPAQAYSLTPSEAKRELRQSLAKDGYHIDTTKGWSCYRRTPLRVFCDIGFYDYSDGNVYCGTGTVIEHPTFYRLHYTLTPVEGGCDY